jgi:hypothetical protein
MTHTIHLEERKARALDHALKLTEENLADLGLPTERVETIKAEPILTQDYALPVLVADLAMALKRERLERKKLGVALGELHDRVAALEKG